MVPIPKSPLRPTRVGRQSQEASLGVGESQPPAAKLLAQDPVLGLKVFDDVLLAAVPRRLFIPGKVRREACLTKDTYGSGS
jgi:hypothetical protein